MASKVKRLCLTCKYEPVWSEWKGEGDYKRCVGDCRFSVFSIPVLPAVYRVEKKSIVRYLDDSGIPAACATYVPKEGSLKCSVCDSPENIELSPSSKIVFSWCHPLTGVTENICDFCYKHRLYEEVASD